MLDTIYCRHHIFVALHSDFTCFYYSSANRFICVLLGRRSTTTFHPDACAAMHDLLPKLENWKRSGNPDLFLGGASESQKFMDQDSVLQHLQEGIRDRMKSLLRTRTLKGFPVNMPFTDLEEVLSKVMCAPPPSFKLYIRAVAALRCDCCEEESVS